MLAGKGFTLSRPRAVPSRPSPLHLELKGCLASGVRSHLHVKASAAARSSSAVKDQIYNREEERAALNLQFDNEPKDMLILLGPANCGKSRLLKEVKKDRESGQAVEGDGPSPVLYLNCRGKDVTSPQGFANAIRKMIDEDAGLKEWWKGIENLVKASTVGFSSYQADLGKLFAPAADEPPMASIIDSLTKFLEVTRPLPYKPVIVIDEAIKLMRWRDDPGHTQLRDLLDFFVKTTKEDHLGHIVLASSESFVIDFLEKEGLHNNQYVTEEIGDLATINEAKEFVERLMLWNKAPSSFFDTTADGEEIDMWPRVYEICGGNIGLLERCAGYADDYRSWQEGLERVGRDIKRAVKRGFSPGGFSRTGGSRAPAAWTKEDYKTVLREIALAKKQKHTVSYDKLEDAVGEDALVSMVEWNLVALRTKSAWAKDLPETLFADLEDEKLVVMPSPVELYFVLKMYEDGKLEAAKSKKLE